ncbi:MAG: prepilin-type N-terminal cleavage/methylation domain-containing protein [Verrucomicrobia bacterium]|nr:prepilin-type N-terminal cleavage/methylation domain-containing protein [Verrucomicrobiota bacterium]
MKFPSSLVPAAHPLSRSFRRDRRAFTLVEILIAATIMGLVSAGMLRILVQTLNVYYYDTGKILVNKDIRKFTSEMTERATYANYFRIFPSYSNLTRTVTTYTDPSDPDQGYIQALADTSVNDGLSGDCLVLVYKDDVDDRKIKQIIVYFRAPADPSDPNSTGPVRRLIRDISPPRADPVWRLIPSDLNPADYPEVVELSRGLANGKLFYNFYDRSIIVKGEIIHRGGMINSRNASATNTYNFTVSPRG